jgi:type I restriction enzyme, S subunit
MSEWEVMALRDAGVLLIDCVHKTPAAVSTGYPYVTIPQMKNGRIVFSDARQISRSDFIGA